jgi:hypothetical protein
MLRLRLLSLALASGLLLALSGCASNNCCEERPSLFPRLFQHSLRPGAMPADCECHRANVIPGPEFPAPMPGPLMPGATGVAVPNGFPTNLPPKVINIPESPRTPYSPPAN